MPILLSNFQHHSCIANIDTDDTAKENEVTLKLAQKIEAYGVTIQKAESFSDLLLYHVYKSCLGCIPESEDFVYNVNHTVSYLNDIILLTDVFCRSNLAKDDFSFVLTAEYVNKHFNNVVFRNFINLPDECHIFDIEVIKAKTCKEYCEKIAQVYGVDLAEEVDKDNFNYSLCKFDKEMAENYNSDLRKVLNDDSYKVRPEYNYQLAADKIKDLINKHIPTCLQKRYLDLFDLCNKKEINFKDISDKVDDCKLTLHNYAKTL